MVLYEIIEAYTLPDPMDVVTLIAKYYNQDLKKATVILIVEGMHQLMESKDNGLKSNSTFYQTLSSYGDLALSGTFVIPVCTSTITGPIDSALRNSTRDRVYLPVASLKSPNYQQGDSFARIEECIVDTLMNDLRYNLSEKYHDAIFSSVEEARPIARAILTRRLLNRNKLIPKTDKTSDEICWVEMSQPQQVGDPILRDWKFADYGEQRALLNPRFTRERDIQFKNHNLQLEVAKHRTDTRSKTLTAKEWNVDCYNSTVDVRQFKHCIINAPTSSYGDSFLSLDQPVSKKEYQEEREKSASENDFFVLFTTANCNIEIPKRSGIVDRNAFTNYFGPFAGRAYRSAMTDPSISNKVKNIHTVSLGQIYNMNQISKERVNAKTKIRMKNFYFQKGLHMISRILPRFM
ncbi:hypothetical protein RhiirA4_457637 [Rhizophagus irregularis]|uniref:Uncharacterized protein n=1 Tax=Rhizophagus irregularis TaxID=588596 RepID=A0A2I1GAG9_9GLOM|nr:hypothetical protein RhiirA4_457637 [Rhizophagus irregularis]